MKYDRIKNILFPLFIGILFIIAFVIAIGKASSDDFGGESLYSAGDMDIFIVKFGNRCWLLFQPRLSTEADTSIAQGIPVFYDSVEVVVSRVSGDSFYITGICDSLYPWIVDDKIFINGADAGIGFNGNKGIGLPIGVPVDSILNPVQARNVTSFIPWSENSVEFKLADTQRAIYGNTAIYLRKILPDDPTGIHVNIREIPEIISVNFYPNPFNPITTISYSIPSPNVVDLRIYDVQGRLVRILKNEPHQAGKHMATWNGVNTQGTKVSTGVYFYRLEAGGQVVTRKIVLLK